MLGNAETSLGSDGAFFVSTSGTGATHPDVVAFSFLLTDPTSASVGGLFATYTLNSTTPTSVMPSVTTYTLNNNYRGVFGSSTGRRTIFSAQHNIGGATLPTSFSGAPSFQCFDFRGLTGSPVNSLSTIDVVSGGVMRGSAIGAGTNNTVTVTTSHALTLVSGSNAAGTIVNNIGVDALLNGGFTGGTGINAPLMAAASSGGTINAVVFANTNTATCGAGFVAGTAGDICLYRGAASAWLVQNTAGTGASLWVSKYVCAGCTSAPSNTAAGAISTTKAAPTLQAYGAVTASAASGLLSFTVSTAAVTCATAVVTNTNVVAGSTVFLEIQKYTGTYFTNGIPIVARTDTSGSSAGSFTLNLCNIHATTSLSGSLFVSFFVLN